MSAPPAPLPYPLRIGVTGHRDLDDEAAIAKAVHDLLEHVERTLKSANSDAGNRRTPLEWIVVSPLAKGADRIVARAVLAQPDASLRVIAPFPLDEYRKDFTQPEDAGEFEELLRHDPSPTELEAPAESADRSEGYLRVGRAVVDQSELLVAIWNGEPATGRGGTGDVVEYAIDRGRTVLWIDAGSPSQRAKLLSPEPDEKKADGPLPKSRARPLPTTAKALSPNFHQLAAYNRDPAFDESEYDDVLRRNTTDLHEHAKKAGLPNSDLDGLLKTLLPHYARSDQLAIRYQRLYTRTAVALYTLAASAVTIATVQVLFFPKHLWLIAFEVLAMLVAVVLWWISRREAWHEKWLHDRHFAERVRSTCFTTLLGTGRTPALERARQLLAFYRSPDSWVEEAHAQLLKRSAGLPLTTASFEALKRFVIDGWIGGQAGYHRRNAAKKERAAQCARRGGLALFATTLAMAVLHLLGVGHGEHGHDESAWLGNAITCLAIVLPAWGAAVHAIDVLRDRERIAARSHRMATVLQQIAERAERTETLDELRTEAARAEEIMAAENLEWLASLSFHVPEVPV